MTLESTVQRVQACQRQIDYIEPCIATVSVAEATVFNSQSATKRALPTRQSPVLHARCQPPFTRPRSTAYDSSSADTLTETDRKSRKAFTDRRAFTDRSTTDRSTIASATIDCTDSSSTEYRRASTTIDSRTNHYRARGYATAETFGGGKETRKRERERYMDFMNAQTAITNITGTNDCDSARHRADNMTDTDCETLQQKETASSTNDCDCEIDSDNSTDSQTTDTEEGIEPTTLIARITSPPPLLPREQHQEQEQKETDIKNKDTITAIKFLHINGLPAFKIIHIIGSPAFKILQCTNLIHLCQLRLVAHALKLAEEDEKAAAALKAGDAVLVRRLQQDQEHGHKNREVNARRLFIPDSEGRWKKTVEADRAIQLKLRGEGKFKKHNPKRVAQGLLGLPILDRRNHLAIDDPNGQDRKEESDGEPDPIEQPARSHDVTPDRTKQRIRRRPKQRRRGGEEDRDEDEDEEDIQLDDKEEDIQVDGKKKDVQIDDNDEDPMDIDQQPLRGSKKRNRGAGSGMGAQLAQDVTRSTTTRARANMGSGSESQRRAVKLRSPADDPTEIADDTESSRPAGLLAGAQQHLTAVGSTRPGSVQSSAKLPRAADATSEPLAKSSGSPLSAKLLQKSSSHLRSLLQMLRLVTPTMLEIATLS
ncbi:unnamed protein product [Zymoseptoria tritici ST99CH_1A5]|uniref:Uncharacterized protein n=1 Tax=Zymoseptoria tritici ST99CH_1A5 TaxID=1276529 RepID=A0A1Y6M1X8_ZYMTR|nr:unnamed protein product [Zymoseptoria tritici ST99CH_1A5]